MNGKRKNRSSLGRSPRGRGIDRIPSIDGIYHNASFMHAITSQIGNVVKVYTHTGAVYEGILKTFSSLFEVVLELAHKIDSTCPTSVTVNTVTEKIIFKPHDLIFIEVLDSESDYATRDTFQTDTAISKFNGQVSEKELEPWDCSGGHGDECELDANGSLNGWDVDDMFRKNEQMYGVTSTFDYAMPGYTTQLQNKDSKDYKDAEAKAAKIANEIESNPTYKARADAENGDEEEKFAAVSRPVAPDVTVCSESNNKYVCPPKRKSQPPPAKPARNIHVKVPELKPTNNISYFHPPVPSTNNNNGSHNNSRERINGVTTEPKPQRSITNHRLVGRNYPSADSGRSSSNGFVVSTSSATVDIKQPPSQISLTSPSNSSPSVISSSGEMTVSPIQRKIPPNAPQIHAPPSEHLPPSRVKPVRGREEQFNELKKFSTDFHLSEPSEEPSKVQVTNTQTEEDNRLTSDPSIPVTTEAPSSTVRPVINNSPTAVEPEKSPALPYTKSKLNPNAKEFIYNPNPKPFTPRSSNTPTQSRPHTPQTPSYGVPSVPSIPAAMVVPTYVVTTAQPHYTQPNQPSRYRKTVHMGMSQRPDLTSQMQVAAATGQPLLAPGPIPAQFTVPYSSQTHLANQPYQQMVRMVAQQGGGMVPLVPATINYPPDANQAQHIPYMGQGAMAAGPHHPHHNPHIHGNAVSPQPGNNGQLGMNGNGAANTGVNGANSANNNGHQQPYSSIHHTPQSPASSYTQAPPTNPNAPAFPLMCPMIPAPPPPPPPPPHPGPHNAHHLISGVPSSVHLHHHHHQHQHQSPNPEKNAVYGPTLKGTNPTFAYLQAEGTTENLSWASRNQDLNLGPPHYEASVLTTAPPPWWVVNKHITFK